jgi:hypothetical protein
MRMTDKIGHLLQHHPGGLTMLPDQFAWLQIQRGYLIYVFSILFSENVVLCVPPRILCSLLNISPGPHPFLGGKKLPRARFEQ